MNIPYLFSTKDRMKILSHVVFKTEQFGVNQIAGELKLSKGLVSKYFEELASEGILKRKQGKLIVQEIKDTKALRILLALNALKPNAFKNYDFVKSAGVFGSTTNGTNTENSDIDLWILVNKTSETNLAKLTGELRKMAANIKPIYLTEEKINLLKKEDKLFYNSLFFGSITIYGDGIEAI